MVTQSKASIAAIADWPIDTFTGAHILPTLHLLRVTENGNEQ